jgi:hypothetical protein
MIRLNDFTIILTFQLQIFWTASHKFVRKFLIEELLQTIQTIIIIKIKPTVLILSKKSRITRATSTKSSSYSFEWAVDKIVFRETCNHFWVIIENFRNSKKFTVFKSRNIQVESLNDDSDQLFSSSSFSSQASKKKFHKRSVSLQNISLSYKDKESEFRKNSR